MDLVISKKDMDESKDDLDIYEDENDDSDESYKPEDCEDDIDMD